MIEGKLEKRRKNVIGAPLGKRVIIFVDDLNMPKLDTYGSQPPIELLRQYQDFGGMYDREKLFWKEIHVRHSSVYINILVTYTRGLFSGADTHTREVLAGEFPMSAFSCY